MVTTQSPSKPYPPFFALAALLALTPLLAFFAPRALAFVPAALGLLAILFTAFKDHKFFDIARYPLGWIFAVILLSGLSSLWAVNADDSIERTGKLALLLIPAMGIMALPPQFIAKPLKAFFGLTLFIASCLMIFEWHADAALYKSVTAWSDTTKIFKEGAFNFSNYNRLTVFLALAFWPALSLLRHSKKKIARAVQMMLIITTVFILYKTESQSAQLGFLVAAFFYFIFPTHCKNSWKAVFVALAFVFLSLPVVMPIAFEQMPSNINEISWFGHSYVRERLEIWSFISHAIQDSPLIGYGIEASRNMTFETDRLYFPGNSVLHPHNFMLQIWLEFGVLGVAVFLAFFKQAIDLFSKQSKEQARLNGAVFFGALCIASTGYGLWQGWWLGTLIILYVLCQALKGVKPLK